MQSQLPSMEDICLEEGLLANQEDGIDNDLAAKEAEHPPPQDVTTVEES